MEGVATDTEVYNQPVHVVYHTPVLSHGLKMLRSYVHNGGTHKVVVKGRNLNMTIRRDMPGHAQVHHILRRSDNYV